MVGLPQVKSMKNPPAPVKVVMEAVCQMLSVRPKKVGVTSGRVWIQSIEERTPVCGDDSARLSRHLENMSRASIQMRSCSCVFQPQAFQCLCYLTSLM